MGEGDQNQIRSGETPQAPTAKGSLVARWRDRLRFKRWGKWIAGGAVGFVLLSVVSVEVTSTSSFCNSCHIMGPYYDSWKVSAHSDVACVECHISPGAKNFVSAKLNGLGQVVDDLLNRTSLKPSASVSQFSCTRSGCHSVETLSKNEMRTDVFKFRHDRHLGQKHLGVEISCTTCHSHIRGEKHFEVSTDVCVTCHLVATQPDSHGEIGNGSAQLVRFVARNALLDAGMPLLSTSNGEKTPPDACTACHEPPQGDVEFQGLTFNHQRFLAFGASCESCHTGVTATPPAIDDGRCLQCHTFGVERVENAVEMHRVHSIGEHKVECFSCHGWIRHGAKVQLSSMERFECTNCHTDQHDAQRSNYFNIDVHASLPEERGNPMFLAHVDCTGCHVTPRPPSENAETGSMVMMASAQACDRCHQEGYGEKLIPLWQNATHKLYDQVEAGLQAASAGGADASVLAEVQSILNQVRSDGSWGVHNPARTQRILESARDMLATRESPAGTSQ